MDPVGNIKGVDGKFEELIASIDALDDNVYTIYNGPFGHYKAAQLTDRLWEVEKKNRLSIES